MYFVRGMRKLSGFTNLNRPFFFHALPLTAKISTMVECPPMVPPEGVTDLDNLSNRLKTAILAVDDIIPVSMQQETIEKSRSKTNDGPSCDIFLCLGCYCWKSVPFHTHNPVSLR